jgi:hypothetical protein
MRTLPWRRSDLIDRVRRDLWRYLTPAADIETELLEASALLQMRPAEVRTLGSIQFLISEELGRLLEYLPLLLRRLAATTTHEEEIGTERIRGAIQWGRTLGLRYATGIPHAYVTAPSRRAYQTPENELLVFVLDRTVVLGRESGWRDSASEHVGRLISYRIGETERWLKSRMLLEVERRAVDSRRIMRIRTGRFRRRYQPVLNAYDRYAALVGRLDRQSIRHAIETYGVVSRDDPTLFELYCTFETLDALKALGWKLGRLGLFRGSLRLGGSRGGQRLEVTYQAVPRPLRAASTYRQLQIAHGVAPGMLRPDLILRQSTRGNDRWLLSEMKGGARGVDESARAALRDLLAYRTAFSDVLSHQDGSYGLGIAWGADLSPSVKSNVMLCTPECLSQAVQAFTN